jgi:hypothetical protein
MHHGAALLQQWRATKMSVMLWPSVLPEWSNSIKKSTAKPLVPAGPACDERGARSRQAAGGAAGQAWLRAAVPKKEVFSPLRYKLKNASTTMHAE